MEVNDRIDLKMQLQTSNLNLLNEFRRILLTTQRIKCYHASWYLMHGNIGSFLNIDSTIVR